MAILVACGHEDGVVMQLGHAGSSRPARLIDTDPQRLLRTSSLIDDQSVVEWALTSPAVAGQWDVRQGSVDRTGKVEGLALAAPDGRIAVSREVAMNADEVDAIEVSVVGFLRGRLGVEWAEAGQDFDPARTIDLLASDADRTRALGDDRESIYRFDLSGHRHWHGDVGRIRLNAAVFKDDVIVLRKVSALRRRVDRVRLLRAAESPWKVDLGHEVRTALVALPERSAESTVTVRSGDSLRFAVGIEPTTRHSVRFQITADPEGDERASILWQGTVDPAAGESGRWHDIEVDLAGLAGREVRLRLSAKRADGGTLDEGLAFWAGPRVVGATSSSRRPNVLLISIDALRADHLSLYGYERPTSPNLAAWSAENAAVFRTVVAPAPWTLPSHISLFSGVEALRHGFNHDVGGVENEAGAEPVASLEMMAELLWRTGYATAAATGGAYLHPKYGFYQGFDRYAYWPDRGRDEGELPTGCARALQWLEIDDEGPRFFFLHTYVVHDPFRARQPYFSAISPPGTSVPRGVVAVTSPKVGPEAGFQQVNRLALRQFGRGGRERVLTEVDAPLVRAMYDSGVAAMDEEIGGLLRTLSEGGERRPTLIVFTADHGEALLEHGLAGHIDLYDHTLLIPLLIALPDGRGAGLRIDRQVRLIDVLPTVLTALGLDAPDAIDGVSLLPFLEGGEVDLPDSAWSYSSAANYGLSVRLGSGQKYIFNNTAWPPLRSHEELYDLRADPLEYRNLSGDASLAGPLRAVVRRHQEVAASGLRLRVANSSTGWMRGKILGHMVRPKGTKSPDLPCDCLHWQEMGRAAFDVPPGTSFTLYFEKVFGDELTIDAAVDVDGRAFAVHQTFRVRDLDGIETVQFDGSKWLSKSASADMVATGFSVRWHGSEALSAPSPAESDPVLLDQLRALGYVE